MTRCASVALAATLLGGPLPAQEVEAAVARGDSAVAALDDAAALRRYESVLQRMPGHAGALWRAANVAADLGEFDGARRDSLYRIAESYARRAVLADSASAMARFALAKALGRRALSLGARDRIRYAADVRAEALAALRLDSLHPGALHVLALWNAEIMRLPTVARFLARTLLGGAVFAQASWPEAERLMVRAAASEPDRIAHRLQLGFILLDMNRRTDARTQFELALRLPHALANDRHYQQQADAALKALR